MKYKNIILILFTVLCSNAQLDSLSILINNRDYYEAIDFADDVFKKGIDAGDKFFKKASESALKLDDLDKSMKYLKKARTINDNNNYREEWDRIVRMKKDIEIALKKYTDENKIQESIDELMQLKKTSYSDCALIDYSIGKIYQEEEDYSKAFEWFEKAVNLNPYRSKYKDSLNYIIGKFIIDGDEYYSMRDFTSAIENYLFADQNLSIIIDKTERFQKHHFF